VIPSIVRNASSPPSAARALLTRSWAVRELDVALLREVRTVGRIDAQHEMMK